jgi:hypothetical protein
MQEILFDYKLTPTTWAYISALMMIGMYFKFHRFWSVRNLDLIALICISPGLLLIYHGLAHQAAAQLQAGYSWLFGISGFLLIRLLIDSIMVRRPLLEPNLNLSGLTFTGAALLIFLMANVVKNPQERLESLLAKQESPAKALPSPGFKYFYDFASFSNKTLVPTDQTPPDVARQQEIQITAARSAVIFSHLAVILGMVWVGYRHFDNILTGVAAATLYLLIFYTSQMTGRIDHVVPAALLVWAIAAYRRPILAGILVGAAAGAIYYPWYLVPLWCGFYWRRGVARFGLGVAIAIAAMILSLALWEPSSEFWEQLRLILGFRNPLGVVGSGFWEFYEPVYRYTVLAAFVALCCSLAVWPPQKNLGTLLSCSAAVMLSSQFWHANQGGLFIAWYLPLLILTIFRPNLEDRVAFSAVRALRWPWRRERVAKPQPAKP